LGEIDKRRETGEGRREKRKGWTRTYYCRKWWKVAWLRRNRIWFVSQRANSGALLRKEERLSQVGH
jgi:hypothetical protein